MELAASSTETHKPERPSSVGRRGAAGRTANRLDLYSVHLRVSQADSTVMVKWDGTQCRFRPRCRHLTVTEGENSKEVRLSFAELRNGTALYPHVGTEFVSAWNCFSTTTGALWKRLSSGKGYAALSLMCRLLVEINTHGATCFYTACTTISANGCVSF